MPPSPSRAVSDVRACLMLHGAEAAALGGPSVRVPRTAAALRDLGLDAQARVFDPTDVPDAEVVHLFNVWPPDSALRALHSLKAAGKRVVFSPIFLDFSERPFWQDQLPLIADHDLDDIAAAAAQACDFATTRGRRAEVVPGYHAMIRQMLALADHVVFLSTAEREALAHIGAVVPEDRASLIHNPVDAALWQGGDPDVFADTWLRGTPGPQEYVICVGRIEERKNQLMLARAVRDLPVRLVLTGHAGSPAYLRRIEAMSQGRLILTGRLAPGSEMMRAALAGARAFALPSWAEGAALAALEAAAAGVPLVLSDKSSEREYFGDLATYCDPADPLAMTAALKTAMAAGDDLTHKTALQTLVQDRFSWEGHAQATAEVYHKVTPRTAPARMHSPQITPPSVVLDLTALCTAPSALAADPQMDMAVTDAVQAAAPGTLRICWSARHSAFIALPARLTTLARLRAYHSAVQDGLGAGAAALPQDVRIITFAPSGADVPRAWLHGLADLKTQASASLVQVVHDVTALHPAFGGATDLLEVVDLADEVWATSQACADGLADYLATLDWDVPLAVIHPSGPAPLPYDATGPLPRRFGARRFVFGPCAQDALGNADLLVRLWARFAQSGVLRDVHLILEGTPPRSPLTAAQAQALGIHYLDDLPQDARGWFYGAADLVLCPSQRRGWSLARDRAQAAGTPCLATGEALDPEDFNGWQAAIEATLTQNPAPSILPEPSEPSVTWLFDGDDFHAGLLRAGPRRLATGVRAAERAGAALTAPPLRLHFPAGWRGADDHGRWACGHVARFAMDLRHCVGADTDGGDLTVCFYLRADVPGPDGATLQIADAQGRALFQGMLPPGTPAQPVFVQLPAKDARAELTFFTLSLSTPDPDARIGLHWAAGLDPALCNPLHCLPNPQVWAQGGHGADYDFAREATRTAIAPHLAFDPAWGLGAPEGACDISLPVLPGAGAHRLSLTLRAAATPAAPVQITVLWNGRVLGTHTAHDDMPTEIAFELDADDFARHGPAWLNVHSNSMQVPAGLGLGASPDHGGFGLFDLRLQPAEHESDPS